MKAIFYLSLLTGLLSFSCSKESGITQGPVIKTPPSAETLKNYTIKLGNHYSDQSEVQLMNTPAIYAHVTFDSSAIYTTIDPVNQADINKLIGFSDCGTHHQLNSARLGWSWNKKGLLLYAYAYVNSVRISKILGAVPLNQPLSCSVVASNNYYYFRAAHFIDSIPRHCKDFTGQNYKLFPYFGGDETAPHEIKITILEKTILP
ncbi:MAG: hypothetical protein WKF89_04800 [Chitinophagaceae bacterium]